MGVKVEIPGVEVQGTLKPENLFDTLAALLSLKFDKRITVTTSPPAWMERAAQEGEPDNGREVEKRGAAHGSIIAPGGSGSNRKTAVCVICGCSAGAVE